MEDTQNAILECNLCGKVLEGKAEWWTLDYCEETNSDKLYNFCSKEHMDEWEKQNPIEV